MKTCDWPKFSVDRWGNGVNKGTRTKNQELSAKGAKEQRSKGAKEQRSEGANEQTNKRAKDSRALVLLFSCSLVIILGSRASQPAIGLRRSNATSSTAISAGLMPANRAA
jgi:hypothetical protein